MDVIVIESYKQDYESKKVSTLMVNKKLKAKYDIERELSKAWDKTLKDIFQCLEKVEILLKDFSFPVQIKYKTIINEKVIDFFKDRNTKILIK